MTQRLCRVCKDWHDLDQAWPLECSRHFRLHDGRSALGFPMVISDQMPEMQCMADGKYYDSKAQMRATHKAHGLMEVGNDIDATVKLASQKPERPKITKDEIAQAINKVKNGYRPALPAD
jgi:hypothetical protein